MRGKYEGLYYVDRECLEHYLLDYNGEVVKDIHGNLIYDYESKCDQWHDDLEIFISLFQKRFPSFQKCDTWLDHDAHTVLENGLFYIAVEDNEWSIAIKLLQKESWYGSLEGLQARHFKSFYAGLKECLFELYPSLGTYSGPWTSGRIYRCSL